MESGPQSQPSPQSSPEVNVTCSVQPDLIDEHVGSSAVLSNSVEEEVDIPEPDEADVSRVSVEYREKIFFCCCCQTPTLQPLNGKKFMKKKGYRVLIRN